MKRLSNEPDGIDRLNGGAQFRLAERLAEEIRRPSAIYDSEGKCCGNAVVLAIEGGWGTGKSNVVRMLEQSVGQVKGAVDGKKCVSFVNYDLWAYRQELTRKSILASIVTELTDKQKVLPKRFQRELYELTGTRVSGYTKTLDHYGWMATIAVSVFAILAACRKTIDFLPRYLIGVAVVALVGEFFQSWIYLGCGFKSALSRLGMILRLKSPEIDVCEFRHSHDASVDDFINFMHKVMAALAESSKDVLPHHLVVVFDNLDRLDESEIRQFWSAVHVLFAERKSKRPENLQIIIPYDRNRVRKAFGPVLNGDEHINKTVDIVFDMPEPIMVDWAEFLKDRIVTAFDGSVSEKEILGAQRMFDWLRTANDLTPRSVIALVNDLMTVYEGMLRIESSPTYHVRLEMAMLYLLGWRRRGDEVANTELSLIRGTFLKNRSQVALRWYLQDVDNAVMLAAIVYHLPAENAADILQYERTKLALENGKDKELAMMSERTEFHSVFSTVIHQVTTIENVPRALLGLTLSDAQTYWDEFYVAKDREIIQKHRGIPVLNEWERILIQKISNWRDYYQKLWAKMSEPSGIPFNESLQVQFSESVEEALKGAGRTLKGAFKNPAMEPAAFLNYLDVAAERYPIMNLTCDHKQLDGYVVRLIRQGRTDFRSLRHLSPDFLAKLPHTHAALIEVKSDPRNPVNCDGLADELLAVFRKTRQGTTV